MARLVRRGVFAMRGIARAAAPAIRAM